ncbi:MAG TPA: ABC transporter permease [Opitutaceae bacterium]
MMRVWAVIERDLRRFRRSPMLIVMSCMMPLVQLVFLGYAFGGQIKNLRIGLVDHDHSVPAVRLHAMLQSVAANARTFDTTEYSDISLAMRDLRSGRINGVVEIPPDFSRKLHAGLSPNLGLIEDNTDQFSSNALGSALQLMLTSYNGPVVQARLPAGAQLSIVEVYPYVPYIQFLLPGTIVLSIFVSAMIGGGIIYIDDKARGLHEGYLATPITKFELILGFNVAGILKGVLSGLVLVTLGSVIAGVPDPLAPLRLVRLFILVVATAMALISMMFLIMVRINDPLLPRALFGMLNTVLFFPSGAVYPIAAFPPWMKAFASVNPFRYAVDGFKSVLLKDTGLGAVGTDLLFLVGFSVLTMGLATRLFRRTL